MALPVCLAGRFSISSNTLPRMMLLTARCSRIAATQSPVGMTRPSACRVGVWNMLPMRVRRLPSTRLPLTAALDFQSPKLMPSQ